MDGYDVVVVGGGAAGLAGAVTLARSLRSVLVLDDGRPRHAPTPSVHNLLGREGVAPLDLVSAGRAELTSYGGVVREVAAVGARVGATGFSVDLADGRRVRARALLVASGLVDERPPLPGVLEGWGTDVVHCALCRGWEVRGRGVGVVATNSVALHQALLFRELTDSVTYLSHTAPPDAAERRVLAAAGIGLVEGEVAGLEGTPLTAARLVDGRTVPMSLAVVAPRMVARSAVLDDLGLSAVEHTADLGADYPSGEDGATDVPLLRLAGNVTDLTTHLAGAAAAGVSAACALHMDLVELDVQERITSGRHRYSVRAE